MLPIITSAANPRLKTATRLRESRVRRQERRFLIDGVREIARADASGIEILELYLDASRLDSGHDVCQDVSRHAGEISAMVADFESRQIPLWPMESRLLEKIAFGDRNEGIVALAAEPSRNWTDFESRLPKNPLLGVLEGIEKPGNIGAVFRSADGAGLDGIILADCGNDFFHPNAIRASLGTLFSLPSVSLTGKEAVSRLGGLSIQTVAAICGAAIPYSHVDFTRPTAIVLGSEADGLTDLWRPSNRQNSGGPSITPIFLPMEGLADSLNISTCAAILFYEANRQRGEMKRRASKRES